MEQIQMVDLRGQYARIKGEVDAGIREVIDSAAFVKGGKVAEFQHELEQYLGVKHVIPTGNGTDALRYLIPVLLFIAGVFLSELCLHLAKKKREEFRGHSYVLAGEIAVLIVVGFLPPSVPDMIVNALVTLVSGGKVFVQYRRSFRARLIQSADGTKEMYNRFRSEILSYIGVKERVSWNYDSFNVGRKQFAKINANAKSLIVYFALAPSEIDEKYNFRDVSEKKRYSAVPVRYKITGSRSFQYALGLLEQTAAKFGLDFRRRDEKLDIPYEERDALIRRGLIKVYARRDTGETVTEQQLEQMIAEGAKVEKLSAFTVTDSVNVNEADVLINDATAKQLIALAETKDARVAPGRRTYVNLDTISANFAEGDTVDLASLKEKGLIDKKASACKILARGTLDKSLTVEATDFSLPAVKMIALTGGKVVRIRKN